MHMKETAEQYEFTGFSLDTLCYLFGCFGCLKIYLAKNIIWTISSQAKKTTHHSPDIDINDNETCS